MYCTAMYLRRAEWRWDNNDERDKKCACAPRWSRGRWYKMEWKEERMETDGSMMLVCYYMRFRATKKESRTRRRHRRRRCYVAFVRSSSSLSPPSHTRTATWVGKPRVANVYESGKRLFIEIW